MRQSTRPPRADHDSDSRRVDGGSRPKARLWNNWSPLEADFAAHIYGIYPLGDQHWRAIGAIREEYLRTGSTPDPTTLCNICGLPNKDLAELFPDTCTTLYALAGVPAPRAMKCTDPAPLDRAE